MTTSARIGQGSTYQIWDSGAGPAAYVTVGEVQSITLPERTHERVEATHMGSSGVRETIAGMIDPGAGSVAVNWINGSASEVLVRTLLASGATENHKVVFPEAGKSVIYPAAITSFPKEIPFDEKLTATINFQANGAETWDDSA